MGIRVEGLRETLAMLEAVRTRTAAPLPALTQWAESVEQLVESAALAGRTPEGDRWAPLKTTSRSGSGRSTRVRKGANASHPIGQLTGRMVASIRTSVASKSVSIEVSAPYAKYFTAGSRRRRIPGRRILPTRARGLYGAAFAAFVESVATYTVTGRVR